RPALGGARPQESRARDERRRRDRETVRPERAHPQDRARRRQLIPSGAEPLLDSCRDARPTARCRPPRAAPDRAPRLAPRRSRAPDAALVTGVSGQLALATAALFFAVRYTPLAGWLARRVRPGALVAVVVLAIMAYATVALAAPGRIAQVARVLLVLTGSSPGSRPGR